MSPPGRIVKVDGQWVDADTVQCTCDASPENGAYHLAYCPLSDDYQARQP